MGKLLVLLFVVVPIADIWLLVVIGRHVGFWPVMAYIAGVAVVGSMLAKAEGARVINGTLRAQQEGRVPEEGMLSGLFVLAGGLALAYPGVISDVIGVFLLFPPTRRLAAAAARRWFERKVGQGVIHVYTGRGPDPLDREITGEDDRDVIDVTPVEPPGEPPDDDERR